GRMDDAVAVALKGVAGPALGVRPFRVEPPAAGIGAAGPGRSHFTASLLIFCPGSLVKTKPSTPSFFTRLTKSRASRAFLNGPASSRLVALNGTHQPPLPLNALGDLATSRLQVSGSAFSSAPPAICTQTRAGSS